jgi:hypothetical protein
MTPRLLRGWVFLALQVSLAFGQDSASRLRDRFAANLEEVVLLQKSQSWSQEECRRMMGFLQENEKIAKELAERFGEHFDKADLLIRKQNFLVQNMHDFLTVTTLRATKGKAVLLVIGKTPLHPDFAGLNLIKVSDRDITYIGQAEAEAKELHLARAGDHFPGGFAELTKLDIAQGEETLARTKIVAFDDLASTTAVSPELHRSYSGLQFCQDYALSTGEVQVLDEHGNLRILRLVPESPSDLEKQLEIARELGYAVKEESGVIRLTREGFAPIEIYREKAALIEVANREFANAGSTFRFEKSPPKFSLGFVSDIDAQLCLNLDKISEDVEKELKGSVLPEEELRARRQALTAEKRAKVYEKYGKRYAVALGWVGDESEKAVHDQIAKLMREHRYDEIPELVDRYRKTVFERVSAAQAREYHAAVRDYEAALKVLKPGDPELVRKLRLVRLIEADSRAAIENLRRVASGKPPLKPAGAEWLGALWRRGPPYVIRYGPKNPLYEDMGRPFRDLSDDLFAGRELPHPPRLFTRKALFEYLKHNPGMTALQVGGGLFALREVWDEFHSTSDPTADLRWLGSLGKAAASFALYDAVPVYFELTAGEAAAGLYNTVALGLTGAVVAVKLAGDYIIRSEERQIVHSKLLKAFGGVTDDGKRTGIPEFFDTLGVPVTDLDLRAPAEIKLGSFEGGKVYREKDRDGNFVFRALKEEYHEGWDQAVEKLGRLKSWVPGPADLPEFYDNSLLWTKVTISPGQLIVARLMERAFDTLRAEYVKVAEGSPPGFDEYPTEFRHFKESDGVFVNLAAALSQAEFDHYMKRFCQAWDESPARISGGYAAHDKMDREISEGAYQQFMNAMIQHGYENDGARISFERATPVELEAWIKAGVPIKVDGHLWTGEELREELRRRWRPYEDGWEAGRALWLPLVRKRFPVEKPPAGLPRVSIGEAHYERWGKTPVRTAEASFGAAPGEKVYVGEACHLEFKYAVSDPGHGAMSLHVETNGREKELLHPSALGGSTVEHSLGTKPWSEPGEHVIRLSVGTPAAGATTRYVFILRSRDKGKVVELARGEPLVVSAFPRGWALKEVNLEGRKVDVVSARGLGGPLRHALVEAVRGAITARRVMTLSGKENREPTVITETDAYTLEGIPPILVDGQTYPIRVSYGQTRKAVPEGAAGEFHELPVLIKIEGGQNLKVLGTGPRGEISPSDVPAPGKPAVPDKQIRFEIPHGGTSKDFPTVAATFTLYEDSTNRRLEKTWIVTYTRLDELQDAVPLSWPKGGPGVGGPIGGRDGGGAPGRTPGNPQDGAVTEAASGGGPPVRDRSLPPWAEASDCTKGRPIPRAESGATPGPAPAPGGARAAGAPPANPLDLLRAPQAWKHPTVQRLIDEWLRVSSPDIAPSGPQDKRTWRWSDWAVALGEGTKVAGPPDHGTLQRHEYLLEFSSRFGSRSHGTMREYLEARLRGESGEKPTGTTGTPLRELHTLAVDPRRNAPAAAKAPPPAGNQVGFSAPEINAEHLCVRKLWKLSGQRGKPVLIVNYLFMNPEDPHPEVRLLSRIQKAVSGDKIVLAAISFSLLTLEPEAQLLADHEGVSRETFLAINYNRYSADFAIRQAPTLMVVDRDGVIRYRSADGDLKAHTSQELIKVLKELVPEVDWAQTIAGDGKK